MVHVSAGAPSTLLSISRPAVIVLFVASCLLSIVSWYTTHQGMVLYLSSWFAFLASLGVQTALVLVAWLIGLTRSKRGLLVVVYAITAVVSIAFSYVSLYTWFSARERPALIQRRLYDNLDSASGRAQELLASALGEGRRHVLALEEMTHAERKHGYISRAQDADPYLAAIREAVAREAQTYSDRYREGVGEGLRYTAFDRYAKLARQSVTRMEESRNAIAEMRARLKPLESTESQLRAFRQVYDAVPWSDVEQALHGKKLDLPIPPAYTDYVDHSATGQEDLLLAFQELFTAPTSRHIFAFALAAFIDIIIFLIAFAAGPYFFGSPWERWLSAGAALDGLDTQVFVRNLLRKFVSGAQGLARVESSSLTPGELQFCLILVGKGLATAMDEEGRRFYLLDPAMHENLLEFLSSQSLPLRASPVGNGQWAVGNQSH